MVESFTLITGAGGAFEFKVDGELLYSKLENGRHAEPGELLALFRKRIDPNTPKYGAGDVC